MKWISLLIVRFYSGLHQTGTYQFIYFVGYIIYLYHCSQVDQETMASVVQVDKWNVALSYGHDQCIFHGNVTILWFWYKGDLNINRTLATDSIIICQLSWYLLMWIYFLI